MLSALRFSGRLIVTMATAPRRSTRMVSYDFVISCSDFIKIAKSKSQSTNRKPATDEPRFTQMKLDILSVPIRVYLWLIFLTLTIRQAPPLVHRRPRTQTGESNSRLVRRLGRRRARCHRWPARDARQLPSLQSVSHQVDARECKAFLQY